MYMFRGKTFQLILPGNSYDIQASSHKSWIYLRYPKIHGNALVRSKT